ncbi:MAG: 1,6-dihydroxycyclohexa-2,4-diene-1-carboxylate dehydrogenase [Spongiibacteraceae bacterium]
MPTNKCQRFTDKNVVITGGAQGIGLACSQRFGAEGARIVIIDRAEQQANIVKNQLADSGIDCKVVIADLETFDGANFALNEAKKILGRIDVLVNNVGGTIWAKPFLHYQKDEIIAEVNRSLWPTLWCCHAVTPILVEQKSGVIVNVSSLAPKVTHRIPYSAAKGGVNAITSSLAMELGEYGIRVMGVAPGATDVGERAVPRRTEKLSEQELKWWDEISHQYIERTLLKRACTPDEQASVIAFVASEDASYMTGETLSVGGGYPS